MRAWFPDDRACLDYLDWLRWPAGFVCPHCGESRSWVLPDGRRSCAGCGRRVSVTAGTIFHRTRTPLTVWFAAAWNITTAKNGMSALGLRRVLGIGSYQTAWAMLHRYRTAMLRPGRDRLRGDVEVDESAFGGPRAGKRGRGAAGKVMVAIAVERYEPAGFGRCRLAIIPNAKGPALREFLLANVEPGATIITDGLSSYPSAVGSDYTHDPFNVSASGLPAHIPLPGVHRVAALVKRWLLGTHQGAVEGDHLQAYLDEFTFRFNRRKSDARGMLFFRLLQQSVVSAPVPYANLVVLGKPKSTKPVPPERHRLGPGSLAIQHPVRPWRS